MKTQAAIEHFGSKSAVAAALGIYKQAVSQWGELVPETRAYQIQVVTGGALKVDPAEYGGRAMTDGNRAGPDDRRTVHDRRRDDAA